MSSEITGLVQRRTWLRSRSWGLLSTACCLVVLVATGLDRRKRHVGLRGGPEQEVAHNKVVPAERHCCQPAANPSRLERHAARAQRRSVPALPSAPSPLATAIWHNDLLSKPARCPLTA